MLTVTLSANHWYTYICSCHRLHTVQTLLHSVTYHIQMTCLYPDCIRRRGWWGWCHRPDSCQANDCNSQVTLTKGWWCWNLLTASKHSHIKKLNIERKAKRSCNIKKCLFFFISMVCRNVHCQHLFHQLGWRSSFNWRDLWKTGNCVLKLQEEM